MNQTEMPKYKCSKQVWALKIKDIEPCDYGASITPEDDGHSPFYVSRGYLEKHNPQIGGYFVAYKDGYHSYSPAAAFEEGYTLITERDDES